MIVWIEIEKKLNEIHYKNQETWSESGVFFLFFFCSYIFVLSLDWATVFVKILFISCWNYTSPCRLFISWYLLITVHFCFPNLDKKFFVLISALTVFILLLFSSKSHCSFKIVPIKIVYCLLFVIFHQYLYVFFLFHPLTCIY